MKFGQLIQYNVRNMQKIGRETSRRPLFYFLKKPLYKVKVCGQHLEYSLVSLILEIHKKIFITFQTLTPEIYSILSFYKRFSD